jgi:hypothetical protein
MANLPQEKSDMIRKYALKRIDFSILAGCWEIYKTRREAHSGNKRLHTLQGNNSGNPEELDHIKSKMQARGSERNGYKNNIQFLSAQVMPLSGIAKIIMRHRFFISF